MNDEDFAINWPQLILALFILGVIVYMVSETIQYVLSL